MIFGHHFQNAYVTRNLDKAVEDFRRYADIRSEFFYEGHIPIITPQGDDVMHLKLALMWVGDMQWEFIQPFSGIEHVYIQSLPKDDKISFHHICIRVPDWDELKRRIADTPYPILFEGSAGAHKYLYVDARPYCGHLIEYTCTPQDIWLAQGGL